LSMTKSKKSKSVFRENGKEITVRSIKFLSPKEQQQFLMNMAIGAEFDMRQRAHYEYYGKELIDYKLGHISPKANEFLRVLSAFMANCLEDNCPPSWKECNATFWEELIFTFYPNLMKISQTQSETENFLLQLKKYVRWLDKRVGTNWFPVVEKLAEEAFPDLKNCEALLNDIFSHDFPRMYDSDWDPVADSQIWEQRYADCDNKLSSIFEVTSMIDKTVVVTEFETNKTYYIKDLPTKSFKQGLIMSGVIAKKEQEKAWTWFRTDGIYPNRGKAYIKLVIKTPLPAGSF
jgi:hypothetical protein